MKHLFTASPLSLLLVGGLLAQTANAPSPATFKSGAKACLRKNSVTAVRPIERAKVLPIETYRFVATTAKCPRGYREIATFATPELVQNITQNIINQSPQGATGPRGLTGATGAQGVQGIPGTPADLAVVNNINTRVVNLENYNQNVTIPRIGNLEANKQDTLNYFTPEQGATGFGQFLHDVHYGSTGLGLSFFPGNAISSANGLVLNTGGGLYKGTIFGRLRGDSLTRRASYSMTGDSNTLTKFGSISRQRESENDSFNVTALIAVANGDLRKNHTTDAPPSENAPGGAS